MYTVTPKVLSMSKDPEGEHVFVDVRICCGAYMSSMFDVHRHTLLGDEQNVYLWTCEYVVVQRAAWMGIASTPPETRIAWKSERT